MSAPLTITSVVPRLAPRFRSRLGLRGRPHTARLAQTLRSCPRGETDAQDRHP